jgi:hypothetical protein
VFIPAAKSPTAEPLLVVANEVSGTTTVFRFSTPSETPAAPAVATQPSLQAGAASTKQSIVTTVSQPAVAAEATDLVLARCKSDGKASIPDNLLELIV